ncbi:preprotein translocase subunit SecA [bacterium]|nr:preprotein translocase subunit SecA [bacterium]NUN46195.1 preprotein translocase subunit SecA [bacterium]
MIQSLLSKIFGNKHERDVKKLYPIVDAINQNFQQFDTLSDDELRAKTNEFRDRIRESTKEEIAAVQAIKETIRTNTDPNRSKTLVEELKVGEKTLREAEQYILDEILPEAFACVKQACKRLVGQKYMVCGREVKWDMVPYDVQMIGGIALHEGKISEMSTGEGKTLVAVAPVYLNALAGHGVHLVTVNDYLALRDKEWMGKVYEFLGLTIGVILNDMNPTQRRVAYGCDITYGTNNEFGFDYLRDNMATSPDDVVQIRGHHYAIVDEVDSVLIDEARTPLIISGAVDTPTNQKYEESNPGVRRLVDLQTRLVSQLVADADKLITEGKNKEAGIKLLMAQRGAPKNKRLMKAMTEEGVAQLIQSVESEYLRDKKMHEIDEELFFAIDEKNHGIDLTEKGRNALSPSNPEMFVIPDLSEEIIKIDGNKELTDHQKAIKKEELGTLYAERSDRIHSIEKLLTAYSLYEKDVEYVVQDGKVQIVDEFTGRILHGRRYSDGLHQAIEAKENVKVEKDTQTLATITLQNYFRLYSKLAGMTGTASTESTEFYEIYKLDVTAIPTNKPIQREDFEDMIYRTKREKYNAVIELIRENHKAGKPTLVGTTSVEVSETLSRMLSRTGIKHEVLNAKQNQREAEIISNAGQKSAVTIATNMAGRGTDIKLGSGVVEAGGLQIIGTERHESRRIDLQLRGRSGRQGDPGSSVFFISLEDDLMRLFGSDRIARVMDKLGAEEGEVISHRWITKAVERAQKRVEFRNFSIRKRLIEYDDVMNQQREIIYSRRRRALMGENIKVEFLDVLDEFVEMLNDRFVKNQPHPEDWDLVGLTETLLRSCGIAVAQDEFYKLNAEQFSVHIRGMLMERYQQREEVWSSENMRRIERIAVLKTIDERWKEHLREMEEFKEGIHLRGYGQKDPLIEYKTEGFEMFMQLLDRITSEIVEFVFRAEPAAEMEQQMIRRARAMKAVHASSEGMGFSGSGDEQAERPVQSTTTPIRAEQKVGRNDPCPCGSGKKYKQCHGK